MAERFKMTDLMAAALAGTPEKALQSDERPTAQATPEAPQRTRAFPRDPLPTREQREEARTLAQQHRAYAEAWFQVLRRWKVEEHHIPIGRVSYAFARGYEPISTMGEGGAALPTALQTPVGQLRETEVGRMITSMAASGVPDRQEMGKLLDRLRSGMGPTSLLREDGRWGPVAPRMAAYAVAALTLAVAMGDSEAEGPLRYAGAVMRRPGPPEEDSSL